MVTIKDVAQEAGLSITTVSLVLNNSPHKLSEDTRARVLRAAQALNYHPNAVARGLNRKRMNTIGVVLSAAYASIVSQPYYAAVIDGILDEAMKNHQNTAFFTGHLWMDAEHSLRHFQDGRCDGLLIVAPFVDSDIADAMATTSTPFVVIGEPSHNPKVSYVCADDMETGRLLTRYLLDKGHTQIAFLSGSERAGSVQNRRLGYQVAMAEASLEVNPAWNLAGNFSDDSVRERIDTLLDLPPAGRPTAIAFTNDEMALAALERIKQRGLRVPDDVSIVGVDDIPQAQRSQPGLTTARTWVRESGMMATRMLLGHINDPASERIQQRLAPEIVERGSAAFWS